MKDEITGEDWNDFWHGQSIEEQEKSIEESIIALSKRKLRLLTEIQEINLTIAHLRRTLQQ
jgi:hypothetical protein